MFASFAARIGEGKVEELLASACSGGDAGNGGRVEGLDAKSGDDDRLDPPDGGLFCGVGMVIVFELGFRVVGMCVLRAALRRRDTV